MKYRYQLVDRIPVQMKEGVVYHTQEFELAGLLCACGCGHRITLLVPDSHEVRDDGGYATIRPSIGVFDAPCKSHYVISAGDVQWFPAFTGARAAEIMHSQIARHVARMTRSRPLGGKGQKRPCLACSTRCGSSSSGNTHNELASLLKRSVRERLVQLSSVCSDWARSTECARGRHLRVLSC